MTSRKTSEERNINPYGNPARVVEAVADGAITAVVMQHLHDELAAGLEPGSIHPRLLLNVRISVDTQCR